MLKKVLKWFFYIVLTLIIGLGASIYLFKDRIIELVLVEVNQFIAVPVQVNKVDLDLFHGLPSIAVGFYDVELSKDSESIISAERIYAIINPLEFFQDEFVVQTIELINAEIRFHVDKNNDNNLEDLFKTPEDEVSSEVDTTATSFDLRKIVMRDVRLFYTNEISRVESEVNINRLIGGFNLLEGIYSTSIKTEMDFIDHVSPSWSATDIGIFNYDLALNYDTNNKELSLDKSNFTFRGARADITGKFVFADNPIVDLSVKADEVSLEMLAELLPPKLAGYIREYKSSGSINFQATLKGSYTSTSLPALAAQLSFNDVDLSKEKYNASINGLNMSCQLNIADMGNISTGSFSIQEGSGLLLDNPFSLTFRLKNFTDPQFEGNIKATVTTDWLLAAMEFEEFKSGIGEINISLDLDNIRRAEQLAPVNLSGIIDFNEVAFALNDSLQINNIVGQARFNPDKIFLSNLGMKWLSSDVLINGQINDRYDQEDNIELTLRSDIESRRLAIEDIVALVSASSGLFVADTTSSSDVQLDLDLVASFDSLTFRRFKGADITGEIFYQDKVVEVVDLNGKAMGGLLKLNGKMKQMPNRDMVIQANAKTKGVYIDSLFYVFNNFTQTFIREEHLKGRVYADVDASMYFDKNWRFRRQLLTSYAKIGIVGGELNNFEPIMALSPYLDDKDDNLAQLRFSELVNEVQVKEDTVFIPEMSIRTNVRNIALGGYHTLDQHINYQLAVPIINERVDKDEAFGAVQKSSKGSPNLLFRIKGTTSDYKVNYDLLRATGNVLRLLDVTKIFKKKEEEEMDSSFLNDEEFDWQ